jgi:hypothetical protein
MAPSYHWRVRRTRAGTRTPSCSSRRRLRSTLSPTARGSSWMVSTKADCLEYEALERQRDAQRHIAFRAHDPSWSTARSDPPCVRRTPSRRNASLRRIARMPGGTEHPDVGGLRLLWEPNLRPPGRAHRHPGHRTGGGGGGANAALRRRSSRRASASRASPASRRQCSSGTSAATRSSSRPSATPSTSSPPESAGEGPFSGMHEAGGLPGRNRARTGLFACMQGPRAARRKLAAPDTASLH